MESSVSRNKREAIWSRHPARQLIGVRPSLSAKRSAKVLGVVPVVPVNTVFAYGYFFVVPATLSTAITALLGFECLRLARTVPSD